MSRRDAYDEVYAEALRQAAREVYGTLGQARAERDPTAAEVERERYAHHRDEDTDKTPLEVLRARADRKSRRARRGRGL